MSDIKAKLKAEFPEILFDEALNKYSTFFIGGPADYFYKAKTIPALKKILQFAIENDINFYVLGGGSNVLFHDNGFRGLIIKIEAQEYTIHDDQITIDAGLLSSKAIKIVIENGFSGLEKWVGLPGTIGGAVRGNAGCNGLETKDILLTALLLDPKNGHLRIENNAYFDYAYRHSKLKQTREIVLQATFQLKKDHLTKEEQEQIMQDIRKFRLTKQPLGFSSGSFFKNPSPDKSAGMLIEQSGLKGTAIGKAKVSELHANFLINQRGATAEEVRTLASQIKATVKEKFAIDLQEEVQILSEHGPQALE